MSMTLFELVEDANKKFTFVEKVVDFFRVVRSRVGNFFFGIKVFFDRVTHRGIAQYDLWSLDHTIAKWVAPRLKAFVKSDRHGFPTYFSEWNENECSKERYDEMVKNGDRDPEVAAGTKDGPKKWEDVLNEMVFAFDWKTMCDFGNDRQKRAFYKKYGYKDPFAKTKENEHYDYYYDMTDPYKKSLEDDDPRLRDFGGLSNTVMSGEPDLHTKDPDKYVFKKKTVSYYDVKYDIEISKRAQAGIELFGKFFFSLWD